MLFYLTEANLYRDPQRIAKVISLIETIYSAYKEIIENNKAGVYEDNPQAMNNPKIGEAIKKVEISL